MLEELRELLKNVRDSYDDFVDGTCRCFKDDPKNMEKMIKYLKEHPEAYTDEIIEYDDSLRGI